METRKKGEDKKRWSSLTLNEQLTLAILFLGLGIQIFGFIYVVKALNSNERAVSTNTYLQTYGWTLDIDKIFVENPDLRPYFTDHKPLNPDSNIAYSGKVKAIADYMLDIFDAVLNNKSYFKNDTSVEQQWRAAVRNYFLKSSVLMERFECEHTLYDTALNSVYNSLKQAHPCKIP